MTRNLIRKALLLSLFIAIVCWNAPAAKAYAETATVNTDAVNVRSGPGTSFNVVGSLDKGTIVSVLQHNNGWSKMQSAKIGGWVSDAYLSTSTETALQVKAVTANLRSGAGTSYPKIGEVRKGDALFLLKAQGEWYQVKSPLGVAYINASLVERAGVAGTSRSSQTTTTGGETTSSPIKVYLNDEQLIFDVNPVIENGRTLVPMAKIFSAMGATVNWNPTTSSVIAKKDSTTVNLTIGAPVALVNSQSRILDVPAKIVNGRTLAPLAFVGTALGGRVAWDPDLRQVEISSPPQPGDKLVAVIIDGDSVSMRLNPSITADNLGLASRGQQYGVYAEKDGWYQIVFLGKQAWVAGWLVKPVWNLDLNNNPLNENPNQNVVPNGKELTISYNKDLNGFSINMNFPAGTKSQVSEQAGLITYTFTGCLLGSEYNVRENMGGSQLTISGRNQANGVQVQVTLPSGMSYKKGVSTNRQSLLIYNCITGVTRKTFNASGENITINTALPCSYSELQNGNTMVIRLEGTSRGIAQASYDFSSPSLKSLTIQEVKESDKPITIITIQTKESAKFSIGSSNNDQTLHVLFINTRDIPPRNSLVVIDPGHGGSEIGSSGQYTQEKDINLAIALKVGEMLSQKGIRVEYTHKGSTVNLNDRGPMANLLNAALFVSIHCNAATNLEAQGTETYYYAPVSNPNLYLQKSEREALATAIQQRLAARLGRPDRGVKTENLCVLRTTDMPSALTEVAFLSNSEEERLLNQGSFQTISAQAIAEGIAEIMSKYRTANS